MEMIRDSMRCLFDTTVHVMIEYISTAAGFYAGGFVSF